MHLPPSPLRRAGCLAAGAVLAWSTGAGAQAADSARACPAGRISEIFVDNGSIFSASRGDLDPRFQLAYTLVNRAHIRTRQAFIRREILFREGDCLDQAVLEDSERILRSASFIADADVFAVPQPDGSVHVVVQTRDEWSFRLEPQLQGDEGVGLRGVEVREDNLFGRGHRVSGYIRDQDGDRVYGGAVGTRQLFGTQLDAELSLERTPVGYAVRERISYPFRGETGRWAVRQQLEHAERNFVFWVPDDDGIPRRWLFPERRRTLDLGTVYRLGGRGQQTLVGMALSGAWAEYPSDSLQAPEGVERDSLPPELRRMSGLDTLSTLRLVLLAGQRSVRFQRRRGLDAVRGSEDVRVGGEVELGVGRSLPGFSDDDDLAVQLGVAAAGELPGGVFAGGRATWEGRRDFAAAEGEEEWRDLFGQAGVWAYWRPGPESGHTWVVSGTVAGGWRTTLPFQLTLGSRAGLRGFARHVAVGERRAVATLEHRAFLGWPFPRLFDLGTAAFVDVGKIWAGGDPFAEPRPLHASVGAGLRIAFPPGSRRTYRVDVAVPVAPELRAGGVEVSFGVGQAVGRGAEEEDTQLRRSARRAMSASALSFPN